MSLVGSWRGVCRFAWLVGHVDGSLELATRIPKLSHRGLLVLDGPTAAFTLHLYVYIIYTYILTTPTSYFTSSDGT